MTEDYALNGTPKSPRKPNSLIACIDRIEKLTQENNIITMQNESLKATQKALTDMLKRCLPYLNKCLISQEDSGYRSKELSDLLQQIDYTLKGNQENIQAIYVEF